MEYTALIMAAGSGNRMGLGYNKLCFLLDGKKTIIEKTVSVFKQDSRCTQIILVIRKEDRDLFERLFRDTVCYVVGGDTRQESVHRGLSHVKASHVLIHDGARPWLAMACIDRILDRLKDVSACLLMVPVKDTIKEVVDGRVVKTFARDHLRQAQTPQAFLTKLIRECYDKAQQQGIIATDDAMLVEQCSNEVVYEVEGSYENIKITTLEDIHNLRD